MTVRNDLKGSEREHKQGAATIILNGAPLRLQEKSFLNLMITTCGLVHFAILHLYWFLWLFECRVLSCFTTVTQFFGYCF